MSFKVKPMEQLRLPLVDPIEFQEDLEALDRFLVTPCACGYQCPHDFYVEELRQKLCLTSEELWKRHLALIEQKYPSANIN